MIVAKPSYRSLSVNGVYGKYNDNYTFHRLIINRSVDFCGTKKRAVRKHRVMVDVTSPFVGLPKQPVSMFPPDAISYFEFSDTIHSKGFGNNPCFKIIRNHYPGLLSSDFI